MKHIAHFSLIAVILSLYVTNVAAQKHTRTENIIIVTLDGLRWQEVFNGADPEIMKNRAYVKDSSDTYSRFWNDNPRIRREKLFPFLWNVVAENGRIYGNRNLGNKVNVANPYQFSYPGYNEILSGYADIAINSNDPIPNKNTTILDVINMKPDYKGKVAVFSSWDAFPYIVNKWRSGVYVNSDTDSLKFDNPILQVINDMQFLTPEPVGVRPDVITYFAAREYLKVYHPKVLYIIFDETDDLAHAGMYDQYLKSAAAEDGMIANLWKILQSDPYYKDKTTLLINCDHGRGDLVKDNWRHHGQEIKESGETWLAVIGPDTKPEGEIKTEMQLYNNQIAQTIARLLGFNFRCEHPVGEAIKTVINE